MNFRDLLEEHFRRIPHPREIEIIEKYPRLWENDSIRRKLIGRYPPGRKTDDEYSKMWANAMLGPSLFDSLKMEKSWQGGTILVPFVLGKK